jgi:hypothetical protein
MGVSHRAGIGLSGSRARGRNIDGKGRRRLQGLILGLNPPFLDYYAGQSKVRRALDHRRLTVSLLCAFSRRDFFARRLATRVDKRWKRQTQPFARQACQHVAFVHILDEGYKGHYWPR